MIQIKQFQLIVLVIVGLLFWGFTRSDTPRFAPSPRNGERKVDSTKSDALRTVRGLLSDAGEQNMAICCAIHNEGRFIGEWLLFHRLMGVDKFYLYDTGSDDNTLTTLAPWIASGVVVLHQFAQSQGDGFQRAALRHCSFHYASETEYLLDGDADEFFLPTPILTQVRHDARNSLPSITNFPDRPLLRMLNENPIYANAGAIAVSRHTYKNQGIERLLPGESLLGTQTLRGYMHVFQGEKFEWTKTIVHTKRRKGWIFPGPHVLMHQEFGMEEAGMIDAMAQPLGEILRTRIVAENDPLAVAGDFWYGGKIPHRIYEPLIVFHYIQRDLANCIEKLEQEKKINPTDWRVVGGVAACKGDEQYHSSIDQRPSLFEPGSFYAAATVDRSMQESYYGRYLPSLLSALLEIVAEFSERGLEGEGILLVREVPFANKEDRIRRGRG